MVPQVDVLAAWARPELEFNGQVVWTAPPVSGTLGLAFLVERREQLVDELEAVDPAPGADARLESIERERILLAALDMLDDARRAIVVMHDLDELPMKEITAALGLPLFTGYSRLRAGREDLVAAVRRIRARLLRRDAPTKGPEA
jgi:hypothetical protein